MRRTLPSLLSLALLACPDPDPDPDAGDELGDAEASEDESESETGEPPAPDTDQDGLSDDEEAELGTDPLRRDTDADNYWDGWEVIEGSDPLDPDSRIYTGYWPYNPDKDALEQGSWASVGRAPGTPFPRDAFYDQHGDLVDLYDFANFTINPTNEPAFFVIDVSAMWCGPCHLVAEWQSGVINDDTIGLEQAFPSIRGAVHELRVWWMTFVTESGASGPPSMGDAATWYEVHEDPRIPVFSDMNQDVLANFGLGFFPHFFLLDPELKILYFPSDEVAQQDAYSGLSEAEALL